jgi:hypothetical protein
LLAVSFRVRRAVSARNVLLAINASLESAQKLRVDVRTRFRLMAIAATKVKVQHFRSAIGS